MDSGVQAHDDEQLLAQPLGVPSPVMIASRLLPTPRFISTTRCWPACSACSIRVRVWESWR